MMGDDYCSARVAVDIRPLLAARTGVGKYQASVMRAVIQMNSGVNYEGFGAYDWTPITTDQLDVSSQKEAGAGRAETLLRKVPFAPSAFHVLRSAAYRLSLVRRHVDFFHAFLYRPPAFSCLPFLPVVYDLSHKRLPQYHPVERIRWMSKLDRYIHDAFLVHTISEFSAGEIVDVYGVKRENIIVAPPGVDAVFLQTADPRGTLDKFGLEKDKFFLCVGTLEPRKNIATLVRAYANAPTTLQQRFPLALVGMKGWSESIPSEGERLIQSGALRIIGYITDHELRDLYASARAMAYPSIYEGFGMPIAEARAAGARVIASDIPPHHEASGGSAVFVEPMDVDAWRAALLAASDFDDPVEALLVRQIPGSLTWRHAAAQTLEMYRRIQLA